MKMRFKVLAAVAGMSALGAATAWQASAAETIPFPRSRTSTGSL